MTKPIASSTVRRRDADSRVRSRRRDVMWIDEIGPTDTGRVGGKAASLAELRAALDSEDVHVPNGFVVTADAYEAFLGTPVPAEAWSSNGSHPSRGNGRGVGRSLLRDALRTLLHASSSGDRIAIHDRCAAARRLCLATPIPDRVRHAVGQAYEALCREYGGQVEVAVRSSVTDEESASARRAVRYDSHLNVRGIGDVLEAWRRCAASAFADSAVTYQLERGRDPCDGAVSVVVAKMVRADLASSGVVFTRDPESGNPNVLLVTGSFGLGEPITRGTVSPDTFMVWKEGLRRGRCSVVHRRVGSKTRKLICAERGRTRLVRVNERERDAWSIGPAEVAELARTALLAEERYGHPMTLEWAKDGVSGTLFLVQARPDPVQRGGRTGHYVRQVHAIRADLTEALRSEGKLLATGLAVGSRVATGKVRRYASYAEVVDKERRLRELLDNGVSAADLSPEHRVFDEGDVLVTELTTPVWESLMKRAALVVTEKGGPTSHAAVVAREYGIPAIVGCGPEVRRLRPLMEVTGTCAEGEQGCVFEGAHPFDVRRFGVVAATGLRTAIKLSVGSPDRALSTAMLPSDGVGLARIESMIASEIAVHPLALAHFDALSTFVERGTVDPSLEPFGDRLGKAGRERVGAVLERVRRMTRSPDTSSYFVERLREGVGRICAAFYPRPVLVRLSDLKSNEYRELIGGDLFEPEEENPMIAWRGAARHVDPRFRAAFDLECRALHSVPADLGLDNLQVMVPFCRTPEEGREVARLLTAHGLSAEHGIPVHLMVELPTNVILAERFIDEMRLSGGSIGTNDLVQTAYALSCDDLGSYGAAIDARSDTARRMIARTIEVFRRRGLHIGICGEALSDHPEEIPAFLVQCGITSISVTADALLQVRSAVRRAEEALARGGS